MDLFVNDSNSKCIIFSSASPPSSLGVDALAHSWDPFSCVYAFPPSHLIDKTVYKFVKSKCCNLLLIFSRSRSQTLKNLRRLKVQILDYKFAKEDLIVPHSMKSLAVDPLDLIVCWY